MLQTLRGRGHTVDAIGLGGPALRAAGMKAVASTESVAIMGFADVLLHLPAIRRARSALLDLLSRHRDAIFLPIDSPGMNLGLARAAHRWGRRVVYYVCPQVWAWGRGRVRRLREDVDLTLLLFRFEEEILQREGVRAHWVGHPAGGLSPDPIRREAARLALGLRSDETLIVILPGSRRGEVCRHLAPMLDAAARLVSHAGPGIRVAVSDVGSVDHATSRGQARELWAHLRPIHDRGDSESLLRAADLALIASGTATLETAVLGVPMVVIYKTSALNYAIARRMVRLPRIALANIIAGTDAAPEQIQRDATGPRIAAAAAKLLADPREREHQRAAFASLPERLGGGGSAERAADAVLEFIAERHAAASSPRRY